MSNNEEIKILNDRINGLSLDVLKLKETIDKLSNSPQFKLRLEIFQFFRIWRESVIKSYNAKWGGLTSQEKEDKINHVAMFLEQYKKQYLTNWIPNGQNDK